MIVADLGINIYGFRLYATGHSIHPALIERRVLLLMKRLRFPEEIIPVDFKFTYFDLQEKIPWNGGI
jgi:hypothetical protein